MTLSQNVLKVLKGVVRDSTIKLIGYEMVKNDAEAVLLMAVIKAYGSSAAGFIYASPSRAKSTLFPPDVVLCHPDVGLLVVEAKSHSLDVIQGIEAGSIFIRYQGQNTPKNPIRQAEDQMFEIKHAIEKLLRDQYDSPLVNCMVAFPYIKEADWIGKAYDEAHTSSQLLFREQGLNPALLKLLINALVQETLKRSGKTKPLALDQIDIILRVFGNSDVINEPRLSRDWVEPNKLGSEIDDMVISEKYLSEEQKVYSQLATGQYPRVIRGVAGSGKSIVLANLVARYLHRQLTSLDDAQF